MSKRFWPVLSLALALTLGAVVLAQSQSRPRIPDFNVVSGGDIGFRIEGWEGGQPVGTLVVKIDGRWLDTRSGPALKLLKP